jgi:hypothetical protein
LSRNEVVKACDEVRCWMIGNSLSAAPRPTEILAEDEELVLFGSTTFRDFLTKTSHPHHHLPLLSQGTWHLLGELNIE